MDRVRRLLPSGPHPTLWAAFLTAFVFILLAVGPFPGHGAERASSPPLPVDLRDLVSDSSLIVHFIDVGQGDATLLQQGDVTILIDAGRHDGDEVLPYLHAAGVRALDLVIATHPHADHIGQMAAVFSALPVKEVWMSGNVHTSRVFERLLDAILESEAGYHEPRAGETFFVGDLRLEVLSPAQLSGDLNEDSIVVRVVFHDVALLFTGDAGEAAERAMLQRPHPVAAHVLHVGHHGSRTSTSLPFLEAVAPVIAVYSAGSGNSYGHPHPEVIERLRRAGVTVYGTDVNGTVVVVSDGRTVQVFPERGERYGDGWNQAEGTGGGCRPGQVDVNSAPVEQLVRIIHVGPSRAQAIVEHRPFSSIADLVRVPGLGPARVEAIEKEGLACVGS